MLTRGQFFMKALLHSVKASGEKAEKTHVPLMLGVGLLLLISLLLGIAIHFHEYVVVVGIAVVFTAVLVYGICFESYYRIYAEECRRNQQLVAERDTLAAKMKAELEFLDEEIDCGTWKNHFRVMVQNTSSVKTLKRCRVNLDSSQPSIPHLPLILHCSEADFPDDSVDLAPNARRKWDVLFVDDAKQWIVAGHKAALRNPIPWGTYLITLTAEADDTPMVSKVLVVRHNDSEIPEFRVVTPSAFRRNL